MVVVVVVVVVVVAAAAAAVVPPKIGMNLYNLCLQKKHRGLIWTVQIHHSKSQIPDFQSYEDKSIQPSFLNQTYC